MSREDLFANAAKRFLSSDRTPHPNERQLWFEATDQVKKHWLDGPRRFSEKGEPLVRDEPVKAKTDFLFGAQQGAKLRAVDDLKRSATSDATFISTPYTHLHGAI